MNYFNRVIESYVHNGAIGVLVELGVSDPITTRTELFARLSRDLAMHIAAMAPVFVEELLQQPSIRNPDITVSQQVESVAGEFREKIAILRFVRWVCDSQESLQPDPPRTPAVIYDFKSAG